MSRATPGNNEKMLDARGWMLVLLASSIQHLLLRRY